MSLGAGFLCWVMAWLIYFSGKIYSIYYSFNIQANKCIYNYNSAIKYVYRKINRNRSVNSNYSLGKMNALLIVSCQGLQG